MYVYPRKRTLKRIQLSPRAPNLKKFINYLKKKNKTMEKKDKDKYKFPKM